MEANIDLNDCATCHGTDFTGTGNPVPGCFACHTDGPPFGIHPLPYNDPRDHGPAAKANQRGCRSCHGETPNNFDGGIVADPIRFNKSAGTCSAQACHPSAKAHPTNWQGTNDDKDPGYDSSHRTINEDTVINSCTLCHKTDGPGAGPMTAAPSCFSANFTNSDGITSGCHAGGFDAAPHDIPYTDSDLHGQEAKADLNYCQQCHAQPFDGGAGSNPRFNVPLGKLVNGCEDCHTANSAHPLPLWTGAANNSHKTAGKLSTACALCHGANLLGPVEGGVGRACADCHKAGDPLIDLNCISCHNDPPDGALPAGNTRPNHAGSHAEHDLFPKVVGICITCHNGAGTDTSIHYDESQPADVSLLPTYNAKTGTFAYNAGNNTCSGVSCHGGQQTPDWPAGALNVDTDCLSCHERGTAQFNSYNSGKHKKHLEDLDPDERLICSDCHDTAKLATNHFIGLDTPGFERRADQTLRDALGYNPATNSGCNVSGCHGTESWF
jgi:predicted CxxxxCH...CXXCH cytochrome family protein